MEKLSSNEIRKRFLDFFRSKGHTVLPSFPLVPQKDKSLLLVNSGMAPLKSYFAGLEEPPNVRMATSQKCIRTGDIEIVGETARHATFFEMLGNFSFGDYFKEKSIVWGWEFVIEHLNLPVDKLWITIYLEDDEAFEIWNKKIGVPEDRIIRLGKADNFWEIGVGPSGPCTELYFDRGKEYGCGHKDCKPGCECDRHVEFWNHVFSQFHRDEDGNYTPLPNPNIDTGMGLERMACIMQGVDSIFEIDIIKPILDSVCEITNTEYKKDSETDMSIRIITDHVRSISFMIGDGILPSNEGRGYILRRLLRRAARHGKLLGVHEAFLYKLVHKVCENYKEIYNELTEKRSYIEKVVQVEEERFMETIDQGMDILNDYIEELLNTNEKILSGANAFRLYDTYGFPLDLTKEILEEKGLDLNEEGFEREMEKQRKRAREARAGMETEGWEDDVFSKLDKDICTDFEGYSKLESEGEIIAIVDEGNITDSGGVGDEVVIVLDKTVFYGESGGQVGDVGILFNETAKARVLDTKEGPRDQVHHIVKIDEGKFNTGDIVRTRIDSSLRRNTARNHTATHILHRALKQVLGEHVQQAGSLVAPERLRFDFTHFEGVTDEQITAIEETANEQILNGLDVIAFETSMDEAEDMGAEALFGEKYGEQVRIVKIGDYSTELCGGTHVNNSSEIGMLIILGEGGVAAGVRRIEAITGPEAYKYMQNNRQTIKQIADTLNVQAQNAIQRVSDLVDETREKDKEIDRLKGQLASGFTDELLDNVQSINGVDTIIQSIDGHDMDDLRKVGDVLKQKLGSGVVILASNDNNRVYFTAMATEDALAEGIHCGNLIREAAKVTGGGGGGRPDMAQAGGKNPNKIEDALSVAKEILYKQLGN